MLKTAFVAARDRRRLQEIAGVLIRFGFAKVLDRLGLHYLVRFARRGPAPEVARLTQPQRVRRAIETLGPTFIKLGQIMASRPDLLSPQWTEELGKLHSQVSPIPWAIMGPQLEADLGGSVDALFAEFDKDSIASASIAQVYRARLHTGEDVIVKTLRPGLRKVIEADLRLLSQATRIVESQWLELARYRPQEQLRHLALGLNGELDLVNEGNNCETLAAIFVDREDIVFPKVFWELTSERVLVQEFIHGISPSDRAALDAAGLDKVLLAKKGTDAFLQMALIEGVFHADPHPGNILAMTGNRIGFIDFGIVGRLSQKRRSQLLVLIGAMLKQDENGLLAVLLDWTGSSTPNLTKLEGSAHNFVMRHSGKSLDLGLVLTDFMTMARENDLAMPTDLAILFKGLITADGVMRQLDPDFDLFNAAAPTVQLTMQQRFSFSAFKKKLESAGAGLFGAASELPSLIHLMLVRLKQGKITVEIEIKGMDALTRGIERAAARVAVALVVAAFATQIAPRLIAYSPYAFAAICAIILLIGIGWVFLLRRKH